MSQSDTRKKIRRRLAPEERRCEIMEAAKKVFLKKGYKETSMADLVFASGLSAGGFYHYYHDKSEVLSDLIKEGSQHRFDLIIAYRNQHPELTKSDLLIDLTLAKLFDDSDFKKIYAIFLQEINEDKYLKALYDDMMAKSRHDFDEFCEANDLSDLGLLNTDFFIALTNSIYLGIELLNLRPVFLKEKELMKKIIQLLIQEKDG